MDTTEDLFWTQHVDFATHAREGQTPTTLDLVFTNDPNIIAIMVKSSPLGKNDHCLVK